MLSVVLLNPEGNPLSVPYSIVGKGGLNNNAFRAPKGVRKISPASCTDGIRNVLWDKTGTNTGETGKTKVVWSRVRLCSRGRPRPRWSTKEQKNYSAQRRNISDPFVPPNPKELESAYSTLAFRA